jgi:hypothetical protein
VVALIPLAFPLVVDTCVLQPPIATSGETASASQVFPKGPVVRDCWCTIRELLNPGSGRGEDPLVPTTNHLF